MDLPRKAFSVFCDTAAKNAIAKNKEYREENARLTAIDNCLHSLTIVTYYKKDDNTFEKQFVGKSMDVRDIIGDISTIIQTHNTIGNVYVCHTDSADAAEVPLERLPMLTLSISGVEIHTGVHEGPQVQRPEITVFRASNTVNLKARFGKKFYVEGKVENYPGTLDEIQASIDGIPQVEIFFAADGDRNRPPWPRDACLLGASLKIEKVMVPTSFLQAHMNLKASLSQGSPTLDAGDYNELRLVSQVVPNHRVLAQECHERRALMTSNDALKSSLKIFQSLQLAYPKVSLFLDQGSPGPTSAGKPGWRLELPEDKGTILVSNIFKIKIRLSGVPFGETGGFIGRNRLHYTNDPAGMHMACGTGLEASYLFEETMLAYHRDHGGPESNIFDPVEALRNYQPLPEHSSLTMKLTWITIELSTIKDHLDLLGIDYTGTDTNGNVSEETAAYAVIVEDV